MSPLHSSVSLLLVMLFVASATLSHAVPLSGGAENLSEASGVDLQETQVASGAAVNWHSEAKKLYHDLSTLRNIQVERDFGDSENMTIWGGVRISPPLIRPEHRCFPEHFNTQICLEKIYSGLREYLEYMSDVERESLPANLVNDIKFRTTNLLNTIKLKLKVPQVTTEPRNAMPDDSAWTRKTVVHLVLRNFTAFMSGTCRAINYMNVKNGSVLKMLLKGKAL